MTKQNLLVSFSGGRTSAFMAYWLKQNRSNEYNILVVFANTGKEREETLQFVQECDQRWGLGVVWIEAVTHLEKGHGVTARVVDFHTASRNGEPYESFIQKHGIPNQSAPTCTRELKAYPIRSYARSIGWTKYTTAIGIRADEPKRIDLKKAKKEKILYPLAQIIRITKSDINLFWSRQPFDLHLKSYEGNCDLCWKKSLRKLMTLTQEHPELAAWWRSMENRYGTYIPIKRKDNINIRLPVRFYRGYQTIDDIIAEANFGYLPAVDENHLIAPCRQLDFFDESVDGEFGVCGDSCEPFL